MDGVTPLPRDHACSPRTVLRCIFGQACSAGSTLGLPAEQHGLSVDPIRVLESLWDACVRLFATS